MKDLPRCDFHIHTRYLGCANATMEVPAIVKECEGLGITMLGITDHLNTVDKLDLHLPIKYDLEQIDTTVAVYFGVELNFIGMDGDFAFSDEIKEEYGFQFAIGGIHNTYLETHDLKKIVDIQHRHHLKTCQNPLVDVLVHPYWFNRGEFDHKGWPFFDTMRVVPEHYARELGQVARETGTAIEINAMANLENANFDSQYKEEYFTYLSIIADEGACFALGSDAHDISQLKCIQTTWEYASRLNLTPERIWTPSCKPFRGLAPE